MNPFASDKFQFATQILSPRVLVSLFPCCAVQGSINDRFVKIVIINNFGYSPRTRGDANDEKEEDYLMQSRRVN